MEKKRESEKKKLSLNNNNHEKKKKNHIMYSHSLLSPDWPKVYRRPSSFRAHVYFLRSESYMVYTQYAVRTYNRLYVDCCLTLCIFNVKVDVVSVYISTSKTL